MKVAIFGLKALPSQREAFEIFFKELGMRGMKVYMDRAFDKILKKETGLEADAKGYFSTHDDLPDGLDYFITFGGDGTILAAATIVRENHIPIVGVNTGRLGFLATIALESVTSALDAISSQAYKISKRTLIEVSSPQMEIEFPYALNEITVTRRETTSMITVDAYVNGEFLNSYWADGLIVSTPTGSTGYSLSCGGPIVHPDTRSFVVTAIAPHNLNVRPLMMADDCVFDLKIHSRVGEYFLSLDARNKPLSTDVELHLKRAGFLLHLVEPLDKTYLMTLRDKMFWGSDKRN